MSVTFALVVLAIGFSSACVELIGHAHKATDNATEWDYGFLGDDWVGTDAKGKPWTCLGGHYQSPLNLPRMAPPLPLGLKTQFLIDPKVPNDRPTADVWNNGHTIQVQNFSTTLTSVSIPTLRGSITDMVAHKITNAANVKWAYPPSSSTSTQRASTSLTACTRTWSCTSSTRAHRTPSRTAPSCIAVVGIHVRVGGDVDNEALAPIFQAMPFQEATKVPLPMGTVIDFNKI